MKNVNCCEGCSNMSKKGCRIGSPELYMGNCADKRTNLSEESLLSIQERKDYSKSHNKRKKLINKLINEGTYENL